MCQSIVTLILESLTNEKVRSPHFDPKFTTSAIAHAARPRDAGHLHTSQQLTLQSPLLLISPDADIKMPAQYEQRP